MTIPNTNPTRWVLLYMTLAINVGVIMINFKFCDAQTDGTIDGEPTEVITESGNTCFTPACFHTASQIIKDMDKSVNPCDDFYKFVCGNFLQTTIVPDDENSINTFSEITNEVHVRMKTIVDKPIIPDEPKHITLVKNFYKSCMNENATEEQGVRDFLQIIKRLGGWPVLEGDNWNENDFNWIESVCKFREMGFSVDYFIDFGVSPDSMNSSKRTLRLDQPSLGLSREYLMKGMTEDLVNAYHKYMIDIAVLLGASEEVARKELTESLQFEMALGNISIPSEKRRNITLLHNPMTIKELSEKYPSIPWKECFNRLLAPTIRVDDDDIVNVIVPKYISDFERLINATSKRAQANHAMWRTAMASIAFLNKDIRKVQMEYSSKMNGMTKREPRWRECVETAAKKLPLSVGSLYVKEYFSADARKLAAEMVGDIRNQFNKILEKVDWMDEDTRKSALEKAALMNAYVAYPDELLDDKKLEQYHNGLELSEDDFLGNMMNLSLFKMKLSFGELRTPVNKTDWITHGKAIAVNAFYAPFENSIQIPAALLQKRLYNKDRPKYMNYGAVGFIIGHEITHGFDDMGRQRDKYGNLVDWWAPSTTEKYLRKAECIINQYGNYTDSEVGLQLNGLKTQGENIADNGGIKAAYLAYKDWSSRNNGEPTLPGLGYTPQQLFWISATNMWCTKKKPEAQKSYITTGDHSPPQFRVHGTVTNMIDFANDFKCPEGTAMNPKKKCAVW